MHAEVDQGQEREIDGQAGVHDRRGAGFEAGDVRHTQVRKNRWFDDLADCQTPAQKAAVEPGFVISTKGVVAAAEFRRQRDEEQVELLAQAQGTAAARFRLGSVEGAAKVEINGDVSPAGIVVTAVAPGRSRASSSARAGVVTTNTLAAAPSANKEAVSD
jgi:hypothetical protein